MKKFLIIIGILLALVIAAFIIFHDNTDLEAVEKKQIESIKESTDDIFDNLNSEDTNLDFESTSIDTLAKTN